jgi:predicted DNA-binding transcriptional regulator AlpA
MHHGPKGNRRATGRKPTPAKPPLENPDAYSVKQFCARNGISPSLFYKLKGQGLMPKVFRIGARTLVSKEAAEAWRRAREQATY